MSRALARACIVACGLLLSSCGDDQVTELVVAVDSNIEGLNRIEVRVDFFSDERKASNTVRPDMPDLPQTVGIVHTGGQLGPIDIEATGFVGDDEVAAQRLSRVHFVKGRTMLLRMELTQDCVGLFESCDGEMVLTCVDGACASAVVTQGNLEPYTGEPRRSLVEVTPGMTGMTPAQDPGPPPTSDEPPPAAGANAPPQDAGANPQPDPPAMDAGAPDPVMPPENPCTRPEFALITPECHVLGGMCSGMEPNRVCTLQCEPGWGDCDGDPDTGCETDLLTTAAHCGQCGNACPADPANALSCSCQNGELALQCITAGPFPIPLFADCDGDAQSGCEASLTSDQHCGRCDNDCTCEMFQCVD